MLTYTHYYMNPETPTPPTPSNHPNKSAEPSSLQIVANHFATIFGAIFSWLIFPIFIVLILHFFIFQAFHVVGTSMVPNLHDTDYLIISKLDDTRSMIGRALGHKNDLYLPARGQIIVFHFPLDPTKTFVKRVVGIPGDRVVVNNGVVTLYPGGDMSKGYNPDAKYEIKGTITLIDTDEIVKTGNVFVMGDNRSDGGSYDSRQWGQLPSSYIIGNAVLRLLPLDKVTVF